MLDRADAALIIGDPALRLDPCTLPYHVADLGQEWTAMTGLPMVFAVRSRREGASLALRLIDFPMTSCSSCLRTTWSSMDVRWTVGAR